MFYVLNLILATSAQAVCPKDSTYDRMKPTPSGNACVAVREGGNRAASQRINGDLIWITGNFAQRIADAPVDYVALDAGVLMYFTSGKSGRIDSWTLTDSETKTCVKDIPVRKVENAEIQIQFGKDIIKVLESITSKTIRLGCDASSKEMVFLDASESDLKLLEQYSGSDRSNNLTDPRNAAGLPDVLGREKEIATIVSNLQSQNTRSTLLYGPAGTGKTTIVYGLAKMIAEKSKLLPEWIYDWKVFQIDLGSLSEDGLKGKVEGDFSQIVKASSGKKVILLFDEVHQLVGKGASKETQNDVTEILKPAMADGRLAIIGTTTSDSTELSSLQSKSAFFSRFNRLLIGEPPASVIAKILEKTAEGLKKRFNVSFSAKVIEETIRISKQYITNEFHPRLGIKILENTAARIALEAGSRGMSTQSPIVEATLADTSNEIGIQANVPALQSQATLKQANAQGAADPGKRPFRVKIKDFDKDLRDLGFVGNEKAVTAVYRAAARLASSLQDRERPAGMFLFLGPSGAGKTYLAELTAQLLFDNRYRIWPMAQFQQDEDVKTILNAPPTYIGHDPNGGALVRWLNQNPSAVLNFDEAEKAHPDVMKALLNLMDKGEIEDLTPKSASFRNGFMFFTSNIAMNIIDEYDRAVLQIPNDLGKTIDLATYQGPKTPEELHAVLVEMCARHFGTPFMGRIGKDNIVVFHHHTPEQSAKIADNFVSSVLKSVNKETARRGIKVEIDPSVREYIIKNGFSFNFGARNARDLAHQVIGATVADKLLELELDNKPMTLVVRIADGKPVIEERQP